MKLYQLTNRVEALEAVLAEFLDEPEVDLARLETEVLLAVTRYAGQADASQKTVAAVRGIFADLRDEG